MMTRAAMMPDEASAFASEWLPAWTANDPLQLAAFYTDDVFYSDPSIADGLSGKSALIKYLSKLLADNPDWTWIHTGSVPLDDGFLNKWRLDAPVGDRVIICRGVCTVQLRGELIYRNEVYFDMSPLVGAIREWSSRKLSLRS